MRKIDGKVILNFLMYGVVFLFPIQTLAQTIYPTTPEVKHNDQVGNTKINDDYNWMENFENQKKLNQLLEKQNEFYEAYFANYEPELRTKIIEDLAKYDTRVKQPELYLDKLEDDHYLMVKYTNSATTLIPKE
ncbi:MAG: hypothetical protein HC932_04850 [Thermales bacterium]|nr:hypothetical protein [Thermales bacterium]